MTTCAQTLYLRNNTDAQMVFDHIKAHPYIEGREIGLAFPDMTVNRRISILQNLYNIGLITKAKRVHYRKTVWVVA